MPPGANAPFASHPAVTAPLPTYGHNMGREKNVENSSNSSTSQRMATLAKQLQALCLMKIHNNIITATSI